jgi:hypothetical protein
MRFNLVAAAAALFASSIAPAQESATPAAPDYRNASHWLCLPGREDACGKPLPTTALNANGYGSVGQSVPAENPPADCFYVYPTISRDPGVNSDLTPGIEEHAAAAVQFARFSSVCKTYAPLYRQATLAHLLAAMSGKANPAQSLEIAYADVVSAWRYYLEHQNQGRPFVLVGHSQGTLLLTQLLAKEIEGTPAAARMLSAILLGFNVEVPQGKLVGGTFKQTPLCTSVGQTGCVITYVSFRATNPPPPLTLFGRSAMPGMTVACTNPARLRKDRTPLDSYWYAGPSLTETKNPIIWSAAGAPPTPFLRTDGLASAACVNDANAGYLAVQVNADPKDQRTDRIPGDVILGGEVLAGWGLHLADMNLAQGDLIALVEEQEQAFAKRK